MQPSPPLHQPLDVSHNFITSGLQLWKLGLLWKDDKLMLHNCIRSSTIRKLLFSICRFKKTKQNNKKSFPSLWLFVYMHRSKRSQNDEAEVVWNHPLNAATQSNETTKSTWQEDRRRVSLASNRSTRAVSVPPPSLGSRIKSVATLPTTNTRAETEHIHTHTHTRWRKIQNTSLTNIITFYFSSLWD